jgi:hypothetical protein
MDAPSIQPLKRCSKCKEQLPATPEYFHRQRSTKSGLRAACRQCSGYSYLPSPPPAGHKRCSRCEGVFPETSEYFRPGDERYTNGLTGWCRECRRQYDRDYYAADPQKGRDYAKHYRERYPIRARIAVKRWYVNNREHVYEYNRQYRESHPEQVQRWGEKTRESNRIRARKAYWQNPELHKAQNRERQRNNPHWSSLNYHRRRARKLTLPATFSETDWQFALEHFNHRCVVCEADSNNGWDFAKDHWRPLSKGGGTTADNIVPLCTSCNSRKNNRDPHEWLTEVYDETCAIEIRARVEAFFKTVRQRSDGR